jgi:plasmid stabilization system protein ParE
VIVWMPEAEQDRLAIWEYPVARDAVAPLADFPLLGHPTGHA